MESEALDVSSRSESDIDDNAPRRTRTYNPLIKSQMVDSPKSFRSTTLRISPASLAHHLPIDKRQTPCPDLTSVITSWSDLPEAIRAGIVAMIRATKP